MFRCKKDFVTFIYLYIYIYIFCLQAQPKVNKNILIGDSKKSGENSKLEKSEEKITEKLPKSSKRICRKGKIQEKESVRHYSVIEEIQNIKGKEPFVDFNSENTPKSNENIIKSKSMKGKKSSSASGNKEETENLPERWIKKVVVRKSGKTAGHVDTYIYR